MFLEDPQIDLPYSCHAMTRSWLVHGFADQGARLYVGDTLASPSTLFHIDHHADHTHPESEARVGNLAHCAFSSASSGNVRIFGGNPLIWNYQTLCKGEDGLRQQLALYHGYDNFCLSHASLRQPLLQPEPTNGTGSAKQWRPCTPAMAAGLTDQVWTLREVLLFRVPPWPQPAGV